VCSERDGSLYRRHFDPETPILNLLNAARLDEAELDANGPLPDSLGSIPTDAIVCGFVGTNYGPNIEATEHIVEMSEHPDVVESGVHFLVLGKVGDSFTDIERENVYFTGFVEDLNPLYARIDLALNPMTDGGGSNVKVPEYFAHGLPVLTTPFGARGFSLEDEAFATVAELESFPEILSGLDKATADRHGELARQYAESTLNWRKVSRELWDELLELAGETPESSPVHSE